MGTCSLLPSLTPLSPGYSAGVAWYLGPSRAPEPRQLEGVDSNQTHTARPTALTRNSDEGKQNETEKIIMKIATC